MGDDLPAVSPSVRTMTCNCMILNSTHVSIQKPEVRMRASLLRLHCTGWTVAQLAQHFDRTIQAVHNDLTRFEERRMAGLADGYASGQPLLITTAVEPFLHEQRLEERFWPARLLCDTELS